MFYALSIMGEKIWSHIINIRSTDILCICPEVMEVDHSGVEPSQKTALNRYDRC
jgi:hypothetical protein